MCCWNNNVLSSKIVSLYCIVLCLCIFRAPLTVHSNQRCLQRVERRYRQTDRQRQRQRDIELCPSSEGDSATSAFRVESDAGRQSFPHSRPPIGKSSPFPPHYGGFLLIPTPFPHDKIRFPAKCLKVDNYDCEKKAFSA